MSEIDDILAMDDWDGEVEDNETALMRLTGKKKSKDVEVSVE